MHFGLVNILVRWLFIAGVVFAIYNPTGRSYVHWLVEAEAPRSVKLFVGCFLLTAMIVFMASTHRSLGRIGLVVLGVFLLTIAGALLQTGIVDYGNRIALTVGFQLLLVSGLTVGLCWSAIRARLSGQVDSDDVSRRM